MKPTMNLNCVHRRAKSPQPVPIELKPRDNAIRNEYVRVSEDILDLFGTHLLKV